MFSILNHVRYCLLQEVLILEVIATFFLNVNDVMLLSQMTFRTRKAILLLHKLALKKLRAKTTKGECEIKSIIELKTLQNYHNCESLKM